MKTLPWPQVILLFLVMVSAVISNEVITRPSRIQLGYAEEQRSLQLEQRIFFCVDEASFSEWGTQVTEVSLSFSTV